jgi:multiple sugar transport system permease protein
MSFRMKMLAPLLALLGVAVGYPLLYSFYVSLTDYKITNRFDVKFTGLQQYDATVHNSDYWSALAVTGSFVVSAVFIELVLGMCIALALRRQKRFRDFTRSFLLSPMFITPIAVGLMFRFLLNQQLGVIPTVLAKLGMSYDFFGSGHALWSIVMIDVWQWTPFMVLLLLAGLEGLPRQPYEAALIDGASPLYTFRRVTLPLLTPVLTVAVLIRGLDGLKVFEYVYAITRGGPGTETQTIQYLVYNTGITFFRLASASSMAYGLLIIVMVLAVVLFRRVEKARRA